MYGSSVRNFQLFSHLIGSDCMKNVGLVTTRWDVENTAIAEGRESELAKKAWKMMLQHGARKYRSANSQESCYGIVRQLLEVQPSFIQIQIEMGKEQKPLSRTAAGEHDYQETLQRIQTERTQVQELEAVLKSRVWEGVDGQKDEIEKSLNDARLNLATHIADLETITKVPMWGEWGWTAAKTHGPGLAANLVLKTVPGVGQSVLARVSTDTLRQVNPKTASLATEAAVLTGNVGSNGDVSDYLTALYTLAPEFCAKHPDLAGGFALTTAMVKILTDVLQAV
jgi:hypothetical protein